MVATAEASAFPDTRRASIVLSDDARPRPPPRRPLLRRLVRSARRAGRHRRPGAGKSTLLKLLTGTTEPTVGRIAVDGRVAALLELGMGFHPDFTGRQNVETGGRLLGLRDREIRAHLDWIVEFSQLAPYMDQPLRTYSSGMQMRLAFALATAVQPEVLIIDEALAVGDILFQQRCFGRIDGFRAAGTTLLFVAPGLGAVYRLESGTGWKRRLRRSAGRASNHRRMPGDDGRHAARAGRKAAGDGAAADRRRPRHCRRDQ